MNDFTTILSGGSTAGADQGCQCYKPMGLTGSSATTDTGNAGASSVIPWLLIAAIVYFLVADGNQNGVGGL